MPTLILPMRSLPKKIESVRTSTPPFDIRSTGGCQSTLRETLRERDAVRIDLPDIPLTRTLAPGMIGYRRTVRFQVGCRIAE